MKQMKRRPYFHTLDHRLFGAAIVTCAVAGAAPASAQTPKPPAPIVREGPTEIAKGWATLASGNATEAGRVADGLLEASPRNHDAVALKIASRLASRNAAGVAGSLDAYEAWLSAVRQREDVFLLESISKAVLDVHATSTDARVRARALELLAATGDQPAIDRLGKMAAATDGTPFLSDAALARLGQAPAVQRLVSRVKAGGSRDVSDAIDALVDADAKESAGVIESALDPPRPMPTRLAAARALGRLGGPGAIPRLKQALQDPDPPVRVLAAVALARLGDSAGAEMIRGFENSPVGDLRLLAVESSAKGNPSGPWVGVASGVLRDADPMVRLRAAELLLQHAADPGAAREVFAQALADPNPAMRDVALQRLERLPPAALEHDLGTLKKLLRAQSPLGQVEAAGGILRISGAIE
jgi:HEAT repeat protein